MQHEDNGNRLRSAFIAEFMRQRYAGKPEYINCSCSDVYALKKIRPKRGKTLCIMR